MRSCRKRTGHDHTAHDHTCGSTVPPVLFARLRQNEKHLRRIKTLSKLSVWNKWGWNTKLKKDRRWSLKGLSLCNRSNYQSAVYQSPRGRKRTQAAGKQTHMPSPNKDTVFITSSARLLHCSRTLLATGWNRASSTGRELPQEGLACGPAHPGGEDRCAPQAGEIPNP